MSVRSLYFTAPREVECRDRTLPSLDPGTVKVNTTFSAISPGTEKLIYRGDAPEILDTDDPVRTLVTDLSYPTRYGYAAMGRVSAVGTEVDNSWVDSQVFAYNPHETAFSADPAQLLAVPEEIPPRQAPFLANMETAVNFLLDGQPAIGERVAVFGQGVVGLLTTALLAQMPLDCLIAIDPIESRRALAQELGADVAIDPDGGSLTETLERQTGLPDLTFELSGNPNTLNEAMAATGFDGRIIVGSWYGTASSSLDLGDRFHRHRHTIESSQVSTIAPRHEGRWSPARRHEVAWHWINDLPLDKLVTHEIPFERAPKAYELLERSPENALQILLSYE